MKTKQAIITKLKNPLDWRMICMAVALMLSYQTGISKGLDSEKSINNSVVASKDSATYSAQSNADSVECLASAYSKTSNVMYLNDYAADTLYHSARQNRDMAYKMVNSYFEGVSDANSTYNVKKSQRAGLLAATAVFSPLLTAIPMAVASGISPSAKNLHVDASKLKNASYMKGYKYQAHAIKKRQLWGSFVGGGTPWCIVAGFLLL